MVDIKHDGWLERNDEGGLDEVFIEEPVNFHLERMDNGAWWMQVGLKNGRAVVVWLSADDQEKTTVAGQVYEE